MRNLLRTTIGLLLTAFILLGASANSASAQDKAMAAAEKGKATVRVLAENEKVRVQEVHWKAGDVFENPPATNMRVARALKGGTLSRTYADGKTDKVQYKTGEVRINQPDQHLLQRT
jgi:hypothetical protein